MKDKSTAMQLMELVWKNCCEVTGHSWERINRSMQGSLRLAIDAGLRFDRDDFTAIENRMRIGFWGGNDGHMLGERFYTTAVKHGNSSAAQSFEAWKGRKPFMFNWTAYRPTKNRVRLAHNSRFSWHGETVTVTSFSEDGEYLVACSYRWVDKYYRIYHRYKITIADLRADMKARAEAEQKDDTDTGKESQ